MAEYIIQKAIDRKDMSARAIKGLEGKRFDVQPKYDGCHVVFIICSGKFMSALSATGETVRSMDHVGLELARCVDLAGTVAVCGEAWVPNTPFPEISGAFRRHSPQPHLMFAPFDVVSVRGMELYSELPYGARKLMLCTMPHSPVLVPFDSSPYENDVETACYAHQLKALGGYDGAVLHDLDAKYSVGRCRQGEVIKIKPLLEFDLEVVGAELAYGTKTGKNTAALIVRFRNGKHVKVATGLTQAEVDEIHSSVSEHGSGWWGRIIAVEAMAETADGSLREPRYKGTRTDKTQPDF